MNVVVPSSVQATLGMENNTAVRPVKLIQAQKTYRKILTMRERSQASFELFEKREDTVISEKKLEVSLQKVDIITQSSIQNCLNVGKGKTTTIEGTIMDVMVPLSFQESSGLESNTHVGPVKLSKSQKRNRRKKLSKRSGVGSQSWDKREDAGNPESEMAVSPNKVDVITQSSIHDVKMGSKTEEHMEIAKGKTGFSRTATFDAKNESKREECTKVTPGRMGKNTTSTLQAKILVAQKKKGNKLKRRRPTLGEILTPGYFENLQTASTPSKKGNRKKSQNEKPASGEITFFYPKVVPEGEEHTKVANDKMGLSTTTTLNTKIITSQKETSQKPMERKQQCPESMDIVRPISMGSKKRKKRRSMKKKEGSVDFLYSHENTGHKNIVKITYSPASKKKLLIFDVNGLLADIVSPPPKDRKADKNLPKRAIFKRPFLDDFLCFCFERFHVAIWSSRTKVFLDPVVDFLLGDLKNKLLFIWDASHCVNTGIRAVDNKYKCIVLKKLRKIWQKGGPNHLWERGYYDESNTLLVDDSPYKALVNPKYTGIFPFSYSYKDVNDNFLGPGGELRSYLEGVAAAENVKMYVEQHPFGQSAIDEQSQHWSHYYKVLKGQRDFSSRSHTILGLRTFQYSPKRRTD